MAQSPWAVLALVAGLAACASRASVRYVGTMAPTSGACRSDIATLVRTGGAVSFAPSDGALVLAGSVDQTGHAQALLITPGMNGRPYPMQLDGRFAGVDFVGRYRTPACRATVHLTIR